MLANFRSPVGCLIICSNKTQDFKKSFQSLDHALMSPHLPTANLQKSHGNAHLCKQPKKSYEARSFSTHANPLANSLNTSLVSSTPGQIYTDSIPQNMQTLKIGYLYVFCSGESNIDVYFDNLQVAITNWIIPNW
jgi:hypothetical protein